MSFPIIKKSFELPPYSEKEILRYAGVVLKENIDSKLLKECTEESAHLFKPMVCYLTLPVKVNEGVVNIGPLSIHSKDLAKNLSQAKKVILFAATIGIDIDRAIQRQSHISPSKALFFQAIGSERVEALCDVFCNYISETNRTSPRFSPGYGDLPLNVQKDVFRLLDCEKHLGLSLSDSLLITPSKTVTAFMGIL